MDMFQGKISTMN